MISLDLCLSVSSFLLVLYFYFKKPNTGRQLPFPPGPKGWPVIGNVLDIPTEFEWEMYREWCKKFGTDVLHVPVMGTDIIVLDSSEAVMELMERRSSIYSDRRPCSLNYLLKILVLTVSGDDGRWTGEMTFVVGFLPYGASSFARLCELVWNNAALRRKHRRLMYQLLHPTAATQFHPHEIKATHNLLQRFLDEPENVMENLRYMAGETIMSVAYGLPIKQKDDVYIQLAEVGINALQAASVPGASLVDLIPWLKYVPEWMPGAGFKRKAREWDVLARRMVDLPFADAQKRTAEGCSTPSFTSISMQRVDDGTRDEAYQEHVVRGSAGTLYAAGTDTTVSAIASCILGLLENPEIIRKAQAKFDSVIKPGHLPDFTDEKNLSFITALTMESLRWRDVVPIAIPRYLQVDDEYKGYKLPKGSIVIPNAWAMLHDENVYSDPFVFNPERLLTKDGKINKAVRDPRHACFGFGRRICPRRYMAFSAVWIALASILYCFDIEKEKDEDGNIIELCHEYQSSIVIQPKPFKCSIKPRSERHPRAIRSVIIEHEFKTN
ncbi:O-methylsterigmatocystin oxidoreductase [Leucoagaricus sp. SymC.cos]|nr:O-methylsterigmatocystin oxidoreductase [Leucoagaricus sp. SymC.cos]